MRNPIFTHVAAMDDSPLSDLLGHLKASDAGSLLSRVEELRARVLKCVALVSAIFCATFAFADNVFLYLKLPLEVLPESARHLNFTGPLEVFMAYMKVSFLVAVMIAAPILFFQIYKFLKPSLKPEYQRQVMPFFISSLTLFAIGLSFCYFLMLPFTLKYLVGIGLEVAAPMITVNDYTSLVVFMMLGFGAVFQLPIVLILLEALGVIQIEHLTKNRRIIVVIMLVLAALIAPSPDPISQLAMAVPMYLMLEAAILIMKYKKKRAPPALSKT